jgi:hypothetical protein
MVTAAAWMSLSETGRALRSEEALWDNSAMGQHRAFGSLRR